MGLWLDCDNFGPMVSHNTSSRNQTGGGRGSGDGIHLGLSCYGTVSDNISRDNAGFGISLHNSHNMLIGGGGHGNTLANNRRGGLYLFSANRPGTIPYCKVRDDGSNVQVRDNKITMAPGTSVTGVVNRGGHVNGDSFVSNAYFLPGSACTALRWTWYDGSRNVSVPFRGSGTTWQGTFNQDTNGSCAGRG